MAEEKKLLMDNVMEKERRWWGWKEVRGMVANADTETHDGTPFHLSSPFFPASLSCSFTLFLCLSNVSLPASHSDA